MHIDIIIDNKNMGEREKGNVDFSNIYSIQAAVCIKLYYYDRSYP